MEKIPLKIELTSPELEARIQELNREILELEKNYSKPAKGTSRRGFLRKATILGVSTLIGEQNISPNKPVKYEEKHAPRPILKEDIEKKQIINEIESYRAIIERKEYQKILENPYLVSALYYSEHAIDKIYNKDRSPSEEITLAVHSLITKEFRKNYVKYLEETFKNEGGIYLSKESLPLKLVIYGDSLNTNHLDAIDLFIKEGEPIYTMCDGIVVLAEKTWRINDDLSTTSNYGGNTVIIFNPKTKSFYRYAHMGVVCVIPGMLLSHGDTLGTVGHSGTNTVKPGHGGHLHFEINNYDEKNGIMVPQTVFELKERLDSIKQ